MAIPLEMKTNASLLLNDVELIQQNMHSSGPYILVAHAIELMLKAYVKGVTAQNRTRKPENVSHDIALALKEAKKAGLVCSDPNTGEVVERLAKAVKDANLRYRFSFQDMYDPMTCLRVARALQKDIRAVVKPDTPEEIQKRRAAEKEKADEQKGRPLRLP
jgi:hypothetical protein